MYMKWAERQGHVGRIIERFPSNSGGIKLATIELEFKFAYGYLSGERGVHIIRSFDNHSEVLISLKLTRKFANYYSTFTLLASTK